MTELSSIATSTVAQTASPTTLKHVIDVLPGPVYENPTWRGMAYFLRDVTMYVALLVVLVFMSNVFAVAGLEVVMAMVVSGLFVVGHDAAHGALFKSKRMNATVAHMAFLPSLHVYEGWILGHNRVHHPYTVRQGYDFVWHPTTPEQFAALDWWRKAVHRVEWSWVGAGPYYIHQVWWKKMMTGPNPARWVKAIRRDRWIVTSFMAGMLALFTSIGMASGDSVAGILWLDVRTVLLPFLGFACFIGTMVHVHHIAPEIRWWKKAEWNKFKAQMQGTTVLRAPKGFNWFMSPTTSTCVCRCTTSRRPLTPSRPPSPDRSSTSPCASVISSTIRGPASSTTSMLDAGSPTPKAESRSIPCELLRLTELAIGDRAARNQIRLVRRARRAAVLCKATPKAGHRGSEPTCRAIGMVTLTRGSRAPDASNRARRVGPESGVQARR